MRPSPNDSMETPEMFLGDTEKRRRQYQEKAWKEFCQVDGSNMEENKGQGESSEVHTP